MAGDNADNTARGLRRSKAFTTSGRTVWLSIAARRLLSCHGAQDCPPQSEPTGASGTSPSHPSLRAATLVLIRNRRPTSLQNHSLNAIGHGDTNSTGTRIPPACEFQG